MTACENCQRYYNSLEPPMPSTVYFGRYMAFSVDRALAIAQRDAVPLTVLSAVEMRRMFRRGRLYNADHLAHIPEAALDQPIIIGSIHTFSFRGQDIIDGAHRAMRSLCQRRPVLAYVLNATQTLEASMRLEEIMPFTELVSTLRSMQERLGVPQDIITLQYPPARR